MTANNKKAYPRIISVGTANPPDRYTQAELLELFACDDPKIRMFFENSHIQSRHLVLPMPDQNCVMPSEDGTQLLKKHLETSKSIGAQAIRRCLESAGVTADQVDYFATVSSTGFLCPGLSAHLHQEIGFRRNIHRADILGMGCNAGLNGLLTATQYAGNNPGKTALLLTCEICSAAYVFDMSVNNGVVNSLFGDGAAAVLLRQDENLTAGDGPMIYGFESYLIHEAIDEMRFDFQEGKFVFYLGRDIPYVIGENIAKPVDRLLSRYGLKKRDIAHWLVHSGGKKVIDSIKYNLGLTNYDVRHTKSILENFGNLSSAAFLFSFQELSREKIAREGQWGVAMAMGPGTSIETGLLRW